MASQKDIQTAIPKDNAEEIDYLKWAQWLRAAVHLFYSKREQWLRAAVLGANDGIVSISSLMLGIGAVKKDSEAIILTGLVGLCAGACSTAVGEFVSVSCRLGMERARMARERRTAEDGEKLPNPVQAAVVSAFAFSVGAAVPLLAAFPITNPTCRKAVNCMLLLDLSSKFLITVRFGLQAGQRFYCLSYTPN